MSKEVLIIGAGACGLLAGKMLSEKGYRVTIVEGRDRIGGRIFTDENVFSIPSEFGAEFIHGDQPLTLALAKEAGTEAVDLSGSWIKFANGRREKSAVFDEHWEGMLKKLNELEADTDLASFLEKYFNGDKYSSLRDSAQRFVEGYDAADIHRASAFALREEWSESDESPQYRLRGGYKRIMNYLRDGVLSNGGAILLSAPVSGVKWKKGNVTLLISDGRLLEGERVIITVPIGALQHDAIKFSPPLPFDNKIFHGIGFGGVIKFFFEFTDAFWRDVVKPRYDGVAFILSDAPVPTWWFAPERAPIITGWWGGPSTAENHPDDLLIAKALSSLAYIFGCEIQVLENGIIKNKVINWVKDPYSFGAYAYATLETEKARETISTPVSDTIYFAGEALYAGTAMGTVEAAFVSAREITKKLSKLRGTV